MYVEGGILKQNNAKRCQATLEVLSVAEEARFPTFYTHLEQVFSSVPEIHDFSSSTHDMKRFGWNIMVEYEITVCAFLV